MADLVQELIFEFAQRTPQAQALAYQESRITYAELASSVRTAAASLMNTGIDSGDRVAVYLEKRIETVVSLFGIAAAGGVFVPVNPVLKAPQVQHILNDCDVKILVTSVDRFNMLMPLLSQCPCLRLVVLVGDMAQLASTGSVHVVAWSDFLHLPATGALHRRIDSDVAAILYTSGSTGKPKGVVLSHRNLVAGARSVAGYLRNTNEDRILAVLPLSFDYGLNQLTTAFLTGATVVLVNHVFPRDVVKAVQEHAITGLAGVPPLWHQLAGQTWPPTSLRYITNSGGAMPRPLLDKLRAALPDTEIYLMYGLTEAFRSTYLPPAELDRRPDSIGRPIPNADVLVVRPDGSPCEPYEPGELVHRGVLVSLGYWGDKEKTAERFRVLPRAGSGLPLPDIAVWSGDTVYADEEGYFYFVGRSDDMIKVSGYRVSPTEVEEVLLASGLADEAAAFGVPHPSWGQAIVAVVFASDEALTSETLMSECKRKMPAYMTPGHIHIVRESLPRNPNGKLDRKALQASFATLFMQQAEK